MPNDQLTDDERARAQKLEAAKRKLKRLQAQKKNKNVDSVVVPSIAAVKDSVPDEPAEEAQVSQKVDDPQEQDPADLSSKDILSDNVKDPDEADGSDFALATAVDASSRLSASVQEPTQSGLDTDRAEGSSSEAKPQQQTLVEDLEELEKDRTDARAECLRLEQVIKLTQDRHDQALEEYRQKLLSREAQTDSLQARLSSVVSESAQALEQLQLVTMQRDKAIQDSETRATECATLIERLEKTSAAAEHSEEALRRVLLEVQQLKTERSELIQVQRQLNAAITDLQSNLSNTRQREIRDREIEARLQNSNVRCTALQQENQTMMGQLNELSLRIVELTDEKAAEQERLRSSRATLQYDPSEPVEGHSKHQISRPHDRPPVDIRPQRDDLLATRTREQEAREKVSLAGSEHQHPMTTPSVHTSPANHELMDLQPPETRDALPLETEHEADLASLTRQYLRDLDEARAQIRNLEKKVLESQHEAAIATRNLHALQAVVDLKSTGGTALEETHSAHQQIVPQPTPLAIPAAIMNRSEEYERLDRYDHNTRRIRETNITRLSLLKAKEPYPNIMHSANAGSGPSQRI